MIEIILYQMTQPPPRDARIHRAAVRCGDQVYLSWRHSEALQHLLDLDKLGDHSPEDQGWTRCMTRTVRRTHRHHRHVADNEGNERPHDHHH